MSRTARVVGWIVKRIARVLWISTMVLVPLFGFWLASSLAAYHNATQWLALLVGLALFPLLPVGWDLLFVWRRRRHPRPQILTRVDRLVLRTLIVNGVFLGGMMYAKPHAAFRAIAVRGDWMLDGWNGDVADGARRLILGMADRFERRWHQHEEAYGKSDTPPPEPKKPESPTPTPTPMPTPTPDWPVDPSVDVQVKEMPELGSIDEVGKYLAARITDPRRLAKALHDYVALRLTYDHHAADLILAHDYEHAPPQDAESVFAARTGVCAGYAHLLAALGKAAGLDIAYITGYARDSQQRVPASDDAALLASLQGYAHAWNAVHIGDEWLLIDATWDDREDGPIRSTYLFTPPRLFAYQHLPDQDAWQLLDHVMTPGDFVRQPLLTPAAGALGLSLVEPARSQVTVDGEVDVVIENPQHARVAADVVADGSHDRGASCVAQPLNDAHATLHCKVGSGQFEVRLYGSRDQLVDGGWQLEYVGSIQVNGR